MSRVNVYIDEEIYRKYRILVTLLGTDITKDIKAYIEWKIGEYEKNEKIKEILCNPIPEQISPEQPSALRLPELPL